MTEDVVRFFNEQTGMELGPMLDEYLAAREPAGAGVGIRRWDGAIPVEGRRGEVAMPVRVGVRRIGK